MYLKIEPLLLTVSYMHDSKTEESSFKITNLDWVCDTYLPCSAQAYITVQDQLTVF